MNTHFYCPPPVQTDGALQNIKTTTTNNNNNKHPWAVRPDLRLTIWRAILTPKVSQTGLVL